MLDHTFHRRPLGVVQASIQRSDSDSSTDAMDVKATKRWPPRTVASLRNKRFLQEHHTRPQTATLAKPRVLDTCYLTKVDMSLTRKALLNISNLCKSTGKRGGRVPMKAFAKITTSGVCMQLRPNHRPLGRSLSEADESWEDEDSCSEIVGARSVGRTKTFVREGNASNNQGGAKTLAAAKKGTKRTVPEPCHSCGRSDLPERLHSHPATKSRTICRSQTTVPVVTVTRPVKSSVQRPTPIKYKSVVNSKKLAENSHQAKGKPEVRSILKNVFPKPPASPSLGPRPPRSPTKLLAPTAIHSPKVRSKSPNSQKAPASPKVHAQPKAPSSPKPTDKPPASPLTKQIKSPSPKPIHKLSPNNKKKDVSPTRATSPRSFVVVEEKAEKKKPVSPKKVEAKPVKGKLLPCYVCGKDFGASSLPLHESKCLEVRKLFV
jgi:zinc-finger of a C2HC-type